MLILTLNSLLLQIIHNLLVSQIGRALVLKILDFEENVRKIDSQLFQKNSQLFQKYSQVFQKKSQLSQKMSHQSLLWFRD